MLIRKSRVFNNLRRHLAVTMLIVIHDLQEAAALASRVLMDSFIATLFEDLTVSKKHKNISLIYLKGVSNGFTFSSER